MEKDDPGVVKELVMFIGFCAFFLVASIGIGFSISHSMHSGEWSSVFIGVVVSLWFVLFGWSQLGIRKERDNPLYALADVALGYCAIGSAGLIWIIGLS